MRLDIRNGIPDDVIVPGKPDESELVRRIMSDDEEERMPPPESHLALSAEEKELLASLDRGRGRVHRALVVPAAAGAGRSAGGRR